MVEFLNVPSRRQPKVAPGTTVTLFPPTQSGAVGRLPTRLAGWTADGETFLLAAPDTPAAPPSGGNLSRKRNRDTENAQCVEVWLSRQGAAGSNLDRGVTPRSRCLPRVPSAHTASPFLSEAPLQNSPGRCGSAGGRGRDPGPRLGRGVIMRGALPPGKAAPLHLRSLAAIKTNMAERGAGGGDGVRRNILRSTNPLSATSSRMLMRAVAREPV